MPSSESTREIQRHQQNQNITYNMQQPASQAGWWSLTHKQKVAWEANLTQPPDDFRLKALIANRYEKAMLDKVNQLKTAGEAATWERVLSELMDDGVVEEGSKWMDFNEYAFGWKLFGNGKQGMALPNLEHGEIPYSDRGEWMKEFLGKRTSSQVVLAEKEKESSDNESMKSVESVERREDSESKEGKENMRMDGPGDVPVTVRKPRRKSTIVVSPAAVSDVQKMVQKMAQEMARKDTGGVKDGGVQVVVHETFADTADI